MTRTQALAWLATLSASGAAVGSLAGCPSTTTTLLYTPITGLVIDSALLTSGLGCGTEPGQVYKYAAIVSVGADGGGPLAGLPASGVFDCFADAQFSNLPTYDGGTTTYSLAIYAYDEASFPQAQLGGCVDLASDATCQGEDPATVQMYASRATWKTTCSATQVQGVSEVAVCNPLVPTSDASVPDGAGEDASDSAAGGDADDAGEAATDAETTDGPSETSTVDGGAPEAGEAGEAGSTDGGADAGSDDSGEGGDASPFDASGGG